MSFRVGGGRDHAYKEENAGSRDDYDDGRDDRGRGRGRRRDDGSPMAEDRDYDGRGPRRRGGAGGAGAGDDEGADEDDADDVLVEDDGTMDAMQAMMGFSGFNSTKGKKVAGNNVGAVHKAKKTEYRQYMNRVGGFNRPLSPSR